ncbi:MAG: TRIC cation channel family protein [Verrucomicrobiota bacterium]
MLVVWDYLGTFVFCVSGAIAARQKEMDWFGMFVLGLITGTGGGMLRSLMIGDLPPPFLRDPAYFMIAASAVAVALGGMHWWRKIRRVVSVVDALGLGLFLVAGVRISQQQGLEWWACLALGVISATFGGLLRDVVRNEVPLVLRKEIYATACLVGGLAMLGMDHFGVDRSVNFALTTGIVVSIRLWAIRYAIHHSEA